jgi:signal transduction histidine kinase
MRRRVLVVSGTGLAVTASLTTATVASDLRDSDAAARLPVVVLLTCLLATGMALLVTVVDQRARDEADRMTDRLRAQAAGLERSNRELERFATVAAHDLQEPLRGVLTFTSLLERRHADQFDATTLDYLRRVSAAGHRMRALIEDLLVFARTGQAEAGRRFTHVELDRCAAAALANVEGLVIETGATVQVGDLPGVRGDAEALTQLLTNLLANALKYSTGRPEVSVSARTHGGSCTVSVTDRGRGIDPADHAKIFELFRRLDGDESPGTGLGLAICARVAALRGGRIDVRSALGEGATFSVTLPASIDLDTGTGTGTDADADRRRRRREPV